ncbi:MAG TPA: MFS transporter [Ktedonobacteraceae bacterium]
MKQKDLAETKHLPSATTSDALDLATVEHHDPYKALRYRDFRLYFLAVFLAAVGEQMLSVAVGWELYQRTNSALALGLVGLVQVLPVMLLTLFTGSLADRVNRRRMMLGAQALFLVSALGLTVLSYLQGPLWLIYSCLVLNGIAASFSGPVTSSLLSQAVPQSVYENAATWESSSWQLASVGGPALGGLLIALFHRATPVYLLNVSAIAVAIICVALLRADYQPHRRAGKTSTLHSLAEGLRFLRGSQIMLAAITLDLFAVLLGGATSLMPIFARDILRVGPTGLGFLQAAPSIGALCMTLCMAHTPPFKKAGRALLLAVAIFGLATCVFGLSHLFWLSLLSLAILGAMDNVSVVIRSTLLLTRPPDEMRGRVASVNSLFISMSNQLGGFESGIAAQLFGPLSAVVAGGLCTLLVVALVATCWPEMRHLGRLNELPASQHQTEGADPT